MTNNLLHSTLTEDKAVDAKAVIVDVEDAVTVEICEPDEVVVEKATAQTLDELLKEAAASGLVTLHEKEAPAEKVKTTVAQVHVGNYLPTALVAQGDLTGCYLAEDENKDKYMLKVVREHSHGVFLEREVKTLEMLMAGKDELTKMLTPYLPDFVESFVYYPAKKVHRTHRPFAVRGRGQAQKAEVQENGHQVNVFRAHDNFYTLEEIRSAFADGVPLEHAAWMLRRILFALGLVHAKGIVHGAILPDNLLFEPKEHGLILLDWKAASKGNPIGIRSAKCEDLYAPEILNKEKVYPTTDVYMAIQAFLYAVGGKDKLPRALRAWTTVFLQEDPNRRPRDTFETYDEFKTICEDLFGPLKFVPLTIVSQSEENEEQEEDVVADSNNEPEEPTKQSTNQPKE